MDPGFVDTQDIVLGVLLKISNLPDNWPFAHGIGCPFANERFFRSSDVLSLYTQTSFYNCQISCQAGNETEI